MKIPVLKALAPTESVPPFLGTKVVVLLVFLVLGVLAAKRFSAEAGHAVGALSSVWKDWCILLARRSINSFNSTRVGYRESRFP
jgi:hypothetical protein